MKNTETNRSTDRKSPLRVALILDSNAWAGTESHVYTLAQSLHALEEISTGAVTVTVATAPGGPLWRRCKDAGIPRLPIAYCQLGNPRTLHVLVKHLRRKSLDVLHAHNGRTALFALLAVRLAGRGACVITDHFITPDHAKHFGLKERIKSGVHRWLGHAASHRIAISQAVADAIIERGEVDPTHMSIVHNGVAPPVQVDTELTPLPTSLQGQIACVARLEKEKDVTTLVHAMSSVHRSLEASNESVRCVIAGDGSEHSTLEALIKAEHLQAVVELAGFTPLATQIMHSAQICVLPSVAEPFGLAIVEAMAQKRPVVAIDRGGPREIVLQGTTGLLVPPSDASAMAEAILTLLRDPERARAMGEKGFERYSTLFTSRRMAEDTLKIYRTVAPKR